MADKRQLGLYWGHNSFSFVGSEKGQPVLFTTVPFNSPLADGLSPDVPEGVRLTTIIQKATTELKISAKKVFLSLPAKEIIFRSFVIPWMELHEVKNVVDFEATKYIPIKLEDLSYTYHPVTITENNQKRIRILFAAIRKTFLQKYNSILEHTGYQILGIEPAPVSIVRLLQHQKIISRQQPSAVILLAPEGGSIIIVDHDVVQFIRDFQPSSEPIGSTDFNSTLFNDVRVSLNFYARQNPPGKIDKVIVLSTKDLQDLPKGLSAELNIPVTPLTLDKIFNNSEVSNLELINAYGVSLRDKTVSTQDFDLSDHASKQAKLQAASTAKFGNVQGVVTTLVLCAGILYFANFISNNFVSGLKKKYADLQAKQGTFHSSTIEDIQNFKKEKQDKLDAYKNIRLKSNLAFYLHKLPLLLPQGVWLNSLQLNYVAGDGGKSQISISMEGFAYVENSNEQIRLVQTFVSKLREDKNFSMNFKNINLLTVRQESWSTFPVAAFRIVCQ